MKKLPLILIYLLASCKSYSQTPNEFFKLTDNFMKQYVSEGLVDYGKIKSDKVQLNSLVGMIAQVNLSDAADSRKAFLINAYNILTIKNVVDNYPVKSPQDISGFYKVVKHNVGGEKLTLDQLETKKLREVYKDARFHFVLVCGAKGCPPITSFAYVPDKLEMQMELQTKSALNNPEFIRVKANERKVELSEIFKWYENDFKQNGKSVIQFINQFRTEKIPDDYSVDYYKYDWSLNNFVNTVTENKIQTETETKKNLDIQSYTPSVLLKKGQWEYKFFNNLYTQTKSYDADGNKVKYNSRSTYFSSINQFLIGVSPKLNVGIDVWIKSVRNDSENSSPFAVLKFENSRDTRTALTEIGPKIKIAPFKKLPHLSVQSTFLFPVASNLEGTADGKPYLSSNSYTWFTQIYYDYSIGNKFQLFFQVAPWIYIKKEKPKEGNRTSVSTPVDIFFSYFPTKKITLYYENEWWQSYGNNGISSYFRQEGIGMKYQLIAGLLEAETVYTRFTMGKNAGAGETFNLGFRIIH